MNDSYTVPTSGNKSDNYKGISFIGYLTIAALFVLISVTAYVIFVGFSYYWDNMHSDIAGDLLFVREAAYQGSLFPYGWPHLQEMRLVHLTTIVLLFYWITGNIHLSYPLAVSFMLLVNMFLFYYMLSYRKRSMLPIILGFTVLLMFFSNYSQFSLFSILFINGSLAISLSTVLLTIGIYMRIKTGVEHGRNTIIALWTLSTVIAFAQGIQSTRMLIGLYFPLLVVECYPTIISILQNKGFDYKKINKSTIFTIICFIGNLMGIALIHALINRGVVIVEYTLVTSGLRMIANARLWDQISRFIPQVFYALGLTGGVNVYSLSGVAYLGRFFFIITLPIILVKTSARNIKDNIITRISLTSVCSLSIIMIITLTGIGERFMFTLTLFLSMMVIMVVEYFVENKRKVLICITCIFIFFMTAINVNTLGVERRELLIEDRQTVANFIIQEGFSIGYGSFWNGLVLAAVGDFEFDVIYINATTFATRPHGVTLERYNHNENRVFLVLTIGQTRDALDNARTRAILESGERHDFRGGWVVFTFDHNPF